MKLQINQVDHKNISMVSISHILSTTRLLSSLDKRKEAEADDAAIKQGPLSFRHVESESSKISNNIRKVLAK